jgi:hypothetical protein
MSGMLPAHRSDLAAPIRPPSLSCWHLQPRHSSSFSRSRSSQFSSSGAPQVASTTTPRHTTTPSTVGPWRWTAASTQLGIPSLTRESPWLSTFRTKAARRTALHSLMSLVRMGSTPFSTLICEFFFFWYTIHLLKPALDREKMGKPALIRLCATFGLKRNGNKPDLSNRLRDFSRQRAMWEQQ